MDEIIDAGVRLGAAIKEYLLDEQERHDQGGGLPDRPVPPLPQHEEGHERGCDHGRRDRACAFLCRLDGLELLATVHWVAEHEPNIASAADALLAIRQWNPRKKRLMQAEHVSAAWDLLEASGLRLHHPFVPLDDVAEDLLGGGPVHHVYPERQIGF